MFVEGVTMASTVMLQGRLFAALARQTAGATPGKMISQSACATLDIKKTLQLIHLPAHLLLNVMQGPLGPEAAALRVWRGRTRQ